MRVPVFHVRRSCSGQALIESAILIPFLLMLVFNAVNFGFFLVVALNLSAASRSGALYSIQGSATPATTSLPNLASVKNLTQQDLNGALASYSAAAVRVCSAADSGTTGGTGGCQIYPSTATFPALTATDADPEPTLFVQNRVDIAYTFNPLIPGTPFGITLLASPICTSSGGTISCTFYRHVSMRAMN